MKSPETLIKSIGICTAGLLSACTGNIQNEQPNILFIMSDDHAYQAISAYGGNLNQTPNIDRIASEGALFNRCFVTNSICAPCRAVILTGKFSHLNGKIDNVVRFNGDQMTFPKYLQQSGYQTAMIGKWHLESDPQGFDYWNILPGQGNYYNPDFIEMGEKKRFEGYVTSLTTKFALDWLDKRDKTKPFMLMLHHKAPHRNWLPEEQYLDLYEDQEFPFPDNFFDDYSGRGTAAREQEMEIVRDMMWGHDMKFEEYPFKIGNKETVRYNLNRLNDSQQEAWREAYNPRNEEFVTTSPEGKDLARWKFHRYLRDYLKCIKSVDDGVGEVLDYLKANGLEENTIVIYTSDQGFYLGEHGWFDKRFMYEESFRTPLLMKYPREIKAGIIIDEMVQNIDFAPTFMHYAGIEKPADMQGESIREIAAGKKVRNWRDAVYYHYYAYPAVHMVKRHYGVRTDRYKLIHFYYDVDEWELYDLEKDPHEMKNVYDDPVYSDIRTELHEKLEELRLKYKDSDEVAKSFLPEK